MEGGGNEGGERVEEGGEVGEMFEVSGVGSKEAEQGENAAP